VGLGIWLIGMYLLAGLFIIEIRETMDIGEILMFESSCSRISRYNLGRSLLVSTFENFWVWDRSANEQVSFVLLERFWLGSRFSGGSATAIARRICFYMFK